MSKYTTQLRWLVEYNSSDELPIGKRVEQALPYIFNFDYPIWSEDYRRKLERKIVMHYFNKEIGLETVALWKFYLEERLNLIMPYYNELYLTVSKKYDWFDNINVTSSNKIARDEKGEYNNNNNVVGTEERNTIVNDNVDSTSSNTSNQSSETLGSDTPQINFANVDYATQLSEAKSNDTQSGRMNTNSNKNENNKSNNKLDSAYSGKDNRSTNEDSTFIKKGNEGKSKTELNVEYRNSIINIDKLIINELHDLFMLIY